MSTRIMHFYLICTTGHLACSLELIENKKKREWMFKQGIRIQLKIRL